MTIPDFLVLLALVLAAAEEVNARGRSILAWAVLLVCVAWLWGQVLPL